MTLVVDRLFRVLPTDPALFVVISFASLNRLSNSLKDMVTIRSGRGSSLGLFHFGTILEVAFLFRAISFGLVVDNFGFLTVILVWIGS